MVKHQPELFPGHVRVGVHHLEPIDVPVEGYQLKVNWLVFITLQTPRPSWSSSPRQIAHSWAHRRLQHPQTSLPGRSPY